jgi:signal transduction histidine kinase
LLDLAKIEAGKLDVQLTDFTIGDLFSAMRGMLRPLAASERVSLVFEAPLDFPMLHTDEAKIAQILRNLISNALKFTEEGAVRVSGTVVNDGDGVAFVVADTGVGIAEEDQQRIFEEFTELPNPFQRRTRGTGLGLPLSRKLAILLGGEITVESTLGRGSTFTATVPIVHPSVPRAAAARLAE